MTTDSLETERNSGKQNKPRNCAEYMKLNKTIMNESKQNMNDSMRNEEKNCRTQP